MRIFKWKKNGKEYSYNGKLFYEGDFLKGKKTGRGKEYNHEGKVIYEGDYLNGKKTGMEKNITKRDY